MAAPALRPASTAMTLARARQALKDPSTAVEFLDQALPRLSPRLIRSMGTLVFDILRLPDQQTSTRALGRVVAHRPEWINQVDENGNSALMVAAQVNDLDAIDILLAARARVDQSNNSGLGVLDIAAGLRANHRHQAAMAQALLESAQFTQAQKNSALRHAASSGNPGMLRVLLDHGANPVPMDTRHHPILILACRGSIQGDPDQQIQVVSALLDIPRCAQLIDHGWDNRHTGSPLRAAAMAGQLGIARLLLDRGASINPPPDLAEPAPSTPLMWAVNCCHREMVQSLLGAGANARLFDAAGNNALHYAAAALLGQAPDDAMVKSLLGSIDLLVAAGADPAARNAQGKDPSDIARSSGHDDLAGHLAALVSSTRLDAGTPPPIKPSCAQAPRI